MAPFRLLLSLLHITWKKVTRRTAWFFLRLALYHNIPFIAAMQESVEEIFGDLIQKTTVVLYTHRGYGYGESTDQNQTLYWEAPLAITLWQNDRPIAGMALELMRGMICIRQLQGVAGAQFDSKLHPWPKMFVQACVQSAKKKGLRGVRLYRADQSLFYHYPSLTLREEESFDEAVAEHQKRLRRRYDGTARQLGFTMKKRFGEWRNT